MRTFVSLSAAALLSACASTHPIAPKVASGKVDFSAAETVNVSLSNFAFAPTTISLKAGKPYALHLVNAASGGHDFTAPEFFAAARLAPDDAAQVAKGQVELKGGQSATVHLVPAAGDYKLICTHLGHAALGMKGMISVR